MNREEKIEAVKKLLKIIVYLPNNFGISIKEADDIYNYVVNEEKESKIDDIIVLLFNFTKGVGNKIQFTISKIDKIVLNKNEEYEKIIDNKDINNLFINF